MAVDPGALGALGDVVIRIRGDAKGVQDALRGVQDQTRQAGERVRETFARLDPGRQIAESLRRIPEAAEQARLGERLGKFLGALGDPAQVEAVRKRFAGLFESLGDIKAPEQLRTGVLAALGPLGNRQEAQRLAADFQRVFSRITAPEQLAAAGRQVQAAFADATDQARGAVAAGREAGAAFGGLVGTFKALASLAAVAFAVQKIREWVSAGAQFNAQVEQMVLGMKAVLATNIQVTDQFGQQVEGQQKLQVAGDQISLQMERLKRDALLTTATLQQLVETMQVAIGPGSAVGLSLDQIRQLTVALSQMAAAIGLPLVQIPIEVREILEGTIQYRTRLAQVLNIQNEQVNNWKAQGTLFQELITRTKSFQTAGQQAGETWIGILSTLQDFREQLAGAALAPAMDLIRRGFVAIRDALGEVRGGIFVFNESVVRVRDAVGQFAADAVRGFLDFLDRLRPVGAALAELAAPLGDLLRIAGSITASLGVLAANLVVAYNEWLKWTGIPGILRLIKEGLDKIKPAPPGAVSQVVEDAKRDAEAAADSAKAAEQRQRVLAAEVSGLREARGILLDNAASREEQAKTVNDLARQYEALRPFLNTEATQTKAVTAEIERMVAAREKAIETATSERAAAIQREIDQRRRIVALAEARRAEIEPGLPDLTPEVLGKLDKIDRGLRAGVEARAEEARKLRQEEIAGLDAIIEKTKELAVVSGKPIIEPRQRPETPDQLKERLARETEGRKAAAQELLNLQENAEAALARRRAEFEAREGATIAERLAFERQALAEKQRIEREKLRVSIEALELETQALRRTRDERQQADLAVAARIEDQARRAREVGQVAAAAELERKANEARVKAAAKATPELVRAERELADKRADLTRLTVRHEAEAILQRKELRDKERQEEEDLFDFRKKLGEISLLQEIDRQQRLAAAAAEGSKRQRDALVQIRDLEKKLQAERESEALGEIGKLQERLKKGPLGRFTIETRFREEDLAEALEQLRQEQREAIERGRTQIQREGLPLQQEPQVALGVGAQVGGVKELVEAIREERTRIERQREVGGVREVLAGALRGVLNIPGALVPEIVLLRDHVVKGLVSVRDAVKELVALARGEPAQAAPGPAAPAPPAATAIAAPPPVDLAAERERLARDMAAVRITARQAEGLLSLAQRQAARAATPQSVGLALPPPPPPAPIPGPPPAAEEVERRRALTTRGFFAEPPSTARRPEEAPPAAAPDLRPALASLGLTLDELREEIRRGTISREEALNVLERERLLAQGETRAAAQIEVPAALLRREDLGGARPERAEPPSAPAVGPPPERAEPLFEGGRTLRMIEEERRRQFQREVLGEPVLEAAPPTPRLVVPPLPPQLLPAPRRVISPAEEEFLRERTQPPPGLGAAGALLPAAAELAPVAERLAAGFEGLPAQAEDAMARVVKAVADNNGKILAEASSFQSQFVGRLFESIYGQFVERVRTEMSRAGLAV